MSNTETRSKFEQWYLTKYPKSYLKCTGSGTYMSSEVQKAWTVWQAALETQNERVASTAFVRPI